MTDFSRIDLLKKEIDKLRPFSGELLKSIKQYYKIGLTWSSNALEGNTLTESETKVLIEDGLTVGGKQLNEVFEAIGHAEAYEFMFSLCQNRKISEYDIKNMHKLFYKNIDTENSGNYRKIPVVVTGSKFPVCDPLQIEHEMNNLYLWMEKSREKFHPIEFSAKLHKKFVFIHPFIDGNGRLARLLMNTALIQDGYMLAVIPPILRAEYVQLLEKAHSDDKPFVSFIGDRVFESEKEIMRLLNIPRPKDPKTNATRMR